MRRKQYIACVTLVRAWGLEPQRREAREPKSRMSTNSIRPAYSFYPYRNCVHQSHVITSSKPPYLLLIYKTAQSHMDITHQNSSVPAQTAIPFTAGSAAITFVLYHIVLHTSSGSSFWKGALIGRNRHRKHHAAAISPAHAHTAPVFLHSRLHNGQTQAATTCLTRTRFIYAVKPVKNIC